MKNDNTGIATLRKGWKITENTTEKANILNSQVSENILRRNNKLTNIGQGKSNYPKMKKTSLLQIRVSENYWIRSIQTKQLVQIKSVEKY